VKRTAIENLLKWNQTSDVRPVLITGSKGVGKTYLAYDFAKALRIIIILILSIILLLGKYLRQKTLF
jgi:predicted AAA+ superfamily ATPase